MIKQEKVKIMPTLKIKPPRHEDHKAIDKIPLMFPFVYFVPLCLCGENGF
jgi:hypothetical protein